MDLPLRACKNRKMAVPSPHDMKRISAVRMDLDQTEKFGRRKNGYRMTAMHRLEMFEIARYHSVGRACDCDFEKRQIGRLSD